MKNTIDYVKKTTIHLCIYSVDDIIVTSCLPDVVFSIYSLVTVGCGVGVCGWWFKLPVVETVEKHLS